MLASSGKTIDLDLGSRRFDHDPKHSFVDEEISIPKNQTPDDIFSLKFVSFLSSLASRSPKMANGLFDRTTSNVDDVLMTPVLNTPKSTDVWSTRTQPDDDNFSPEMPSDLEIGLREPPRDLPMDSDIGLRSPCDGVLAKRRKQMREMNKKAEGFNADKVSSENPSYENSPTDLTTRPQRSMPDHQRIPLDGATSGEASLLAGTRANIPSSPRNLPGLLPPPLDVRCYEDFKRPASLQNLNAIKENDLPAHINPSPLAVPSPNWSAVELFFGVETIRTPKNLDNPIFEYFGAVPGTPRSASRFKDRSPNPTMDCYSGRDQRLSPRLSPRFPIPEAPTDLSGRPPPASELQALNEVQDLSTRSLKSQSVHSSPLESTSPSPPQTTQVVPPLAIKPTPPHPSLQQTNFPSQIKAEYSKRSAMIITNIDNSHSSEMSSSSLMQQQQNMNELARGADKGELSSSMGSYGTEYAYCQPPPHHLIPQCSAATSYQNPFYNSPGYSHGYQRGMFNNHEMDQTSPPRTSSPSRSVFDRSRYQEWTAMINHPHPNSVHQNFQSQRLNMSHNTSGGSMMTDTHSWNSLVKEEPSISPPPLVIDKFKSRLENKSKKATTNEVENGRKKRVKNQSGDREEKRGRKKGEGKIKKEFCDGTASESKRQYVCQYCQRSYDWNYNLNRHQKYECGKENAFQCAKCGRKFPHKQNCVYHLKRKHKIVYETIDQYMTAGLVIFRGASDSTGHEEPVHSVM